ncbi:MAG: ribosome biogenesis GTPase Der [Thermodesulfobacteriota bacterium]
MKPIVAIVGRPNVGKSTLFNRIRREKKAIVHDTPGVTRDINYGDVTVGNAAFTLVDTGGFVGGKVEDLTSRVREQTEMAIEEADLLIFIMDVKDGLMAVDRELAEILRTTCKPVIYAVNKVDSERASQGMADFFQLGVDEVIPLSAAHSIGLGELTERVVSLLPVVEVEEGDSESLRVAIVGRPNVGKSSLVNRILGYERVVVSEMAGTTTDAIDTPLEYHDRRYTIVDTAGIRRKARVSRRLEEFCVMGAIRSVERCDVAILVIDAVEGITTQDLKIASLLFTRNRGALIVVNKWDLVTGKVTGTAEEYERNLRRRLPFLGYAPLIFVSALTGQRVGKILDLTHAISRQMEIKVPTSTLNRVLDQLQNFHHAPAHKGRSVRIKYITQTGVKPPEFTAFVNFREGVSDSYKRYLIHRMRETFGLDHSPMKLKLRVSGRRS